MYRSVTIRCAAVAMSVVALALFIAVEDALAQARIFGPASIESAPQPGYGAERYQVPRQGSSRYYAPRFDGRNAPGPLIVTPGQIIDENGHRRDVDASADAKRPRMEHWVLRPVSGRHTLAAYQPPSTSDQAADQPVVAEDAPPAPPGELLEPSDNNSKNNGATNNGVAGAGDGRLVHYFVDDSCARRRLGPYPNVGNYDDGYGRCVQSGCCAADYGGQGFLYGTPGNTWWDFYGYPYVGARMSWALPWWGPWGGYGYFGYGYPFWGGYGLYGYGGYGYGGYGYGGYGGYGYYWPRYSGYSGFYQPYGLYGYGGGFNRGLWGRYGYRGSYHW